MNANLRTALLALDAYNRGYNASLGDENNGLGGPGSNLGNVTVLNIPLPQGSQASGFYAVAYKNNSTGEVIISYRGTDGLFGGDGFGNDLWNGYGVGAASPQGKQAELAIKF